MLPNTLYEKYIYATKDSLKSCLTQIYFQPNSFWEAAVQLTLNYYCELWSWKDFFPFFFSTLIPKFASSFRFIWCWWMYENLPESPFTFHVGMIFLKMEQYSSVWSSISQAETIYISHAGATFLSLEQYFSRRNNILPAGTIS